METTMDNKNTIILPGLPHLEWMTENLSGHGGTEVDGRWYYTYDEAVEAVKQLGDVWRLPTRGEMLDLCDLGSTWTDEGPGCLPGRWFGGKHDTHHADSLFLEATGFRDTPSGALTNVGSRGYAWASTPYASGNYNGGRLRFAADMVNPLIDDRRSCGFPVRCVRNVK